MRPLLLALLLLPACRGVEHSPFVRIVHDSGRVYYARVDRALYDERIGTLTFRDLVTREEVKLDTNMFIAQECPPVEVEIRQREYMIDPTRKPGEGEEPPR